MKKGHKMTSEQRQRISDAKKGTKSPLKGMFRSGIGEKLCPTCDSWYKCDSRIGDRRWRKQTFCSKSCALKGNVRTLGKNLGETNGSWKGGIADVNISIRMSYPYTQWRKAVFERDKWTCQMCGVSGVKIHADHIEAFAVLMRKHGIDSVQSALICAELWDTNNGRTLCVPCHKTTDTYAGKVWKLLV